jgi:hypothetical protein
MDVDARLWVRLSGGEGRAYLWRNPHTFPGRTEVWAPRLNRNISICKNEIVEQSPEAEQWLAGFLAGNELRPEDMFGPSIDDAPDDDPRWGRWREAVTEFRQTGDWRYDRWPDA